MIRHLAGRIRRARAANAIRKNGFWFVDIPRTSSTSIKQELGAAYGPAYGKNPDRGPSMRSGQLLSDHIEAERMMSILGGRAEWNRLFTFAIVRNPWDRTISMYRHRLARQSIPSDLTFDRYVELLATTRGSDWFRFRGHHLSCSAFITDDEGNVVVSYVARFENRPEDLGVIGEQLGLPNLGDRHLNRTRTSAAVQYQHQYSDRSRALITELYDDDIKHFDYQFD